MPGPRSLLGLGISGVGIPEGVGIHTDPNPLDMGLELASASLVFD